MTVLTKEMLQELSRPFPAPEIKFKIQAKVKSKPHTGVIVGYLDARNVMERLDEVCGVDWQDAYESVKCANKEGVACYITIGGVTRGDVGDPESDGMDSSLKSAYSDAFKRAAVKFGIGRFLYALPKLYATLTDDDKYIEKGELQRLQNAVENHLANLAVGKSMKSDVTDLPSKREFSFVQMDAILENEANQEFDAYEMIQNLLQMSVLPEDTEPATISAWFNVFLKSKKADTLSKADDANKAYIKYQKQHVQKE